MLFDDVFSRLCASSDTSTFEIAFKVSWVVQDGTRHLVESYVWNDMGKEWKSLLILKTGEKYWEKTSQMQSLNTNKDVKKREHKLRKADEFPV